MRYILGFSVFCSIVFSSGKVNAQGTEALPELIVSSHNDQLSRLKEDTNRIERVHARDLQRKQSQTFAQAIDNERGVDTQTACAFCGAKRITINGLKGEHTTILVDGLPLHSTVSSFYGVEAIPLEGIDSIDIYRGSGAALNAPESIGGAINITTKEIITNELQSRLSWADNNDKTISLLGTRKLNENHGVLLGMQYGQAMPLDQDHNGIAEVPRQNTQTVLAKWQYRISPKQDLRARLSYGQLNTIGGSMQETHLSQAPSTLASSADFFNRDVRLSYLGTQDKITDNVDLTRWELATQYRNKITADSQLKISWGSAWQDQKAIYSHGYDYRNQDHLWVGLAEYQKTLGTNHLLAFGLDSKNQKMVSDSKVLYQDRTPPLPKDDLTYQSLGGYVQDTWFLTERQELSAALRFDHIRTVWQDLGKNIDRSILAPRIYYKHMHNDVLTSRIALGVGYRSPLTLFESQHGTDHNGFVLDIHQLETAQSFAYSLAGQRLDDFFEVSTHVTRIENMAYGVDRADTNQPTVFKNATETYTITNFDFSYGRRFNHHWNMEALYESFHYPSDYKSKLPVAAIEKKLSLTSNIEWQKWTATQKINVIGERDLAAYGYDHHYNIAYVEEDVLNPRFGELITQDQKRQTAPTYYTVDLIFSRQMDENWKWSFSIFNALDYTQTKAGDSPTTWHVHGSHSHLDNFHLWGPLRGRQFFLSVQATL